MRALYARFFNRSLVKVDFAYSTYTRIVWQDADGNNYVTVCGTDINVDPPNYRQVIWLRRKT